MRLPEAKEPFCKVMNQAYPEFSETVSQHREFSRRNFALQSDIAQRMINASNRELLICSYVGVAIDLAEKRVRTSPYYEGSWDLIHPVWTSENTYGRLTYRKTPNWETTDLVCNIALQHLPDQERQYSMHTDSEGDGRVIVEGNLLHDGASSELTTDQNIIVCHLIASLATMELVEVAPQEN